MNKSLTKSRRRRISTVAAAKLTATRRAPMTTDGPLDADLLRKIDVWWRAANYLSVGQTYLYDNPLLKKPLKKEHVKPRLVGRRGTTPFDMCVLNEIDRFHLVQDVIDRLPQLGSRAAYAKQAIRNALIEHRQYIDEHGEDHPFVLGWKWGEKGSVARRSSTEGDNV